MNDVYRFASTGQDGKLILWDFSNSIPFPKSTSVTFENIHNIERKKNVVMIEPVMVKQIANNILYRVMYQNDTIITLDVKGNIKEWKK